MERDRLDQSRRFRPGVIGAVAHHGWATVLNPNEPLADPSRMNEKKRVDLANEPVDYDEGIVDTGVLHEDEEEGKKDDDDA